MQIALASG